MEAIDGLPPDMQIFGFSASDFKQPVRIMNFGWSRGIQFISHVTLAEVFWSLMVLTRFGLSENNGFIYHTFRFPSILDFIIITWKHIENKTKMKGASKSRVLEEHWIIAFRICHSFIRICMNCGFNQQATSVGHLHRLCVLLAVLHAIAHIMRQHKQKSSESFMCYH